MKAFLSTSFSLAIRQQRSDIKEHLRRVGVECDDVEDRLEAQFLFSAIVQKIRRSDFVVLDATVLSRYTMLEIGICAGAIRRPKDIVCVINEDSDQAVRDLPPFVQVLPILTFSYDSGQLVELAARSSAVPRDCSHRRANSAKSQLPGRRSDRLDGRKASICHCHRAPYAIARYLRFGEH